MSARQEPTTHQWLRAALAASNVGTWEWAVEADRVVCCEITAALFGIPLDEAAAGIPLARFVRAIHPDDQVRFSHSIEEVRRGGGLLVAEYRTLPGRGQLRWLLARGRFEVGPDGRVARSRGIVIDVTESRSDGAIEGDPFVLAHSEAGTTLDRLSDHALEMRRVVGAADALAAVRLVPLLDLLLLELGRQQAGAVASESRPRRRGVH